MTDEKNTNDTPIVTWQDVPLPWQTTPWHQLQQRFAQSRFAHGLLLIGTAGLGKRVFAERIAYYLLCAAPIEPGIPCGQCHSCELLQAGNHPDRIVLEPEQSGGSIKIDAVRSLQHELTQTAQLSHGKVVIIDPAEAMNTACSNALLKSLEEPPPHTYFLLLSTQPRLLSATIRSRCQLLRFSPSEGNAALTWLSAKLKQMVSNSDPQALLGLARGAPLLALALVKGGTAGTEELSCDLKTIKTGADPLKIAQKWSKQPLQTLICTFFIELCHELRYLYDPKEELQTPALRLDLKKAYQFYDELVVTVRILQAKVSLNQQLMLEQLLLKWREIFIR